MIISYELEQGYIDVWNEESEEWDRYIKVNKKSVVEEKKIPEKLDIKDIYSCDDCQQIHINFKSTWNKINEIIDYLKSKGE